MPSSEDAVRGPRVLEKAHRLAMSQHHGGVSLEHLLFAIANELINAVVAGRSSGEIQRIIDRLSQPYEVDHHTLYVGASVGSAIGPFAGGLIADRYGPFVVLEFFSKAMYLRVEAIRSAFAAAVAATAAAWMWFAPFCVLSYSSRNVGPCTR